MEPASRMFSISVWKRMYNQGGGPRSTLTQGIIRWSSENSDAHETSWTRIICIQSSSNSSRRECWRWAVLGVWGKARNHGDWASVGGDHMSGACHHPRVIITFKQLHFSPFSKLPFHSTLSPFTPQLPTSCLSRTVSILWSDYWTSCW